MLRPAPGGRQGDLKHAHVGLLREDGERLGAVRRRDQHLDELLGDVLGAGAVDLAVEGDDAAEGRGRVGLQRLRVRRGAVVGHGDAARVGVLDDHARRRGEALDAFPRRVGIGDVVVRELLALQLPGRDERARRGREVAIERGALVRVLAVAQVLQLDEAAVRLRRELVALGDAGARAGERRQVVADRAVVLGDAVEGGDGEREARRLADLAALLQLGDDAGVLRCVGEDGDVASSSSPPSAPSPARRCRCSRSRRRACSRPSRPSPRTDRG